MSTYLWIGGSNGVKGSNDSWGYSANWRGPYDPATHQYLGGPPGAGDDAVLPVPSQAPQSITITTDGGAVGSLTGDDDEFGGNGEILSSVLEGTGLAVAGLVRNFTLDGGNYTAGSASNVTLKAGTLGVTGSAGLTVSGGTVTNCGTLVATVYDGTVAATIVSGLTMSGGEVDAATVYENLSIDGGVLNAGTIAPNGTIGPFVLVDGGTVTDKAAMTVSSGGEGVAVTQNGVLKIAGGITVSSGGVVGVGQSGLTGAQGGGTVSAAGILALAQSADFTVGSGGSASVAGIVLSGGTVLVGSGGSMVVGGGASGDPGLTVAAGATIAGSGSVGAGYVYDNGTIEAQNGTLTIGGNVQGSGGLLIDAYARLEVGAVVDTETVTFNNANGTGELVLDDPATFQGTVAGMEPGDKIILKDSTPPILFDAEIGLFNGTPTLEVNQWEDYNGLPTGKFNLDIPLQIPAITSQLPYVPDEFFNVAQSRNTDGSLGNDTILTLTQGPDERVGGVRGEPEANPVDLAINGDKVPSSITGNDITVGIISHGDEANEMASVILSIAPGVNIEYADVGATKGVYSQSVADAINSLIGSCNVIVDDVSSSDLYSDVTGLLNLNLAWLGLGNTDPAAAAIQAAYERGITYVTCAGNSTPYVGGHNASPFAITVAAMNWLAIPSGSASVGGYITPAQTDAAPPGKIDITAPDYGPTPLPINAGNPFDGTSAAAPAVAAVAALMMSENVDLKSNPEQVDDILEKSVLTGISGNSGAGLVQANLAVQNTPPPKPYLKGTVSNTGALGIPTSSVLSDNVASPLSVASAALSQPGGDVDTGTTVQFQVSMSEAVTVSGGTLNLTLNNGGAATYDATASDPSNGILVFDYTVGVTDQMTNLVVTGVNLNGASVQDSGNNLADFSALFNAPTGVSVNSLLVVQSVTAGQVDEVQAGQTAQLTLTLNEPVTVNTAGGAPTVTLSNAATATYDATASNPGAGTLVFDYTVGANDLPTPNASIVLVDLPDGTTMQDASGNNADFSGAINQNTGLEIGPAFAGAFLPSATGVTKTGQTVQLTLGMSQAVTVDTTGGSPALLLNDGATASYDAAASSPPGGSLIFDYSVGSVDQTPALSIAQVQSNGATVTDANGINANFSPILNIPAELSINSPLIATGVAASAGGNAVTGQTVQVTVTMNEAVQVDTTDDFGGQPTLALNDGASANFDLAESNPSAGALVFDYTVGASDSTPNLAVSHVNLPGPIFSDTAGNLPDFSGVENIGTGLAINHAPQSDFDGDGISEILLHNSGSGSFVDWTMSGAAITAAQNVTFNGSSVALDPSWSIGGLGDFNGDGKSDILLTNPNDSYVDWTMNGSAITSADNLTFRGAPVGLDSSWSVAGVADFNGDGKADILLRSSTTGSFVDWTMNGSSIASADNLTFNGAPVGLDPSWSVAGVGDFNGDGKADILLRDGTTGAFVDLTLNGSAITSADNLTFGGAPVGLDSSWSVLGIGDLNGDGKADILLRGRDGSFVDWTMNGSAIASADNLTFGGNPVKIDSSWTFADIGDFNGDGKADIMLRDGTTGAFVDWTMNGSSIIAAQNLTFNGTPVMLDNSWNTH